MGDDDEVVARGAAMDHDAPGDADESAWALLKEPLKPTWEQIVAMQRESAALRAQAASVLPALPTAAAAGPTPRARRAPSRSEYPLFIPSYRDPPLLSQNHGQFLLDTLHSQPDDPFRTRLHQDRRHATDSFRPEIGPATTTAESAQPGPSAPGGHSRHTRSLSIGLSPEMSQLITPKSAMSGKSDGTNGTNGPITPGSLGTSGFLMEDAGGAGARNHRLATDAGETSRGGGRLRQPAHRQGRSLEHVAVSPTDESLWKGCSGSLLMVTPFADATPATGSGADVSPPVSRAVDGLPCADRPRSAQQHGSSGLFGFLPWGKTRNSGSQGAPLRRQSTWEKDSSKDLEKLIRSLQSQLEHAERQRAAEVGELQSLLKEMQEKLEQLRSHCRHLERQRKHGQHQSSAAHDSYHVDEDDSSSLESASMRARWHRGVPHPSLTPELFLATYDAAVLSLRRLCRAICLHIRGMGESATQVITAVLENHAIASGRLRKAQKLLYFESFLNQIMFENFENASFEPSGGAPVLDPGALQRTSFRAFQELQSVTWDIATLEEGVIVSRSFHQFFVVRMEIVLHQLGDVGDATTPGTVISAFFDAIKAVWLLHHLAFSFRPAATILRVAQGASFEPLYMEQVLRESAERHSAPAPKSVFLMINPGFLVDDWAVKCRVYCSRK